MNFKVDKWLVDIHHKMMPTTGPTTSHIAAEVCGCPGGTFPILFCKKEPVSPHMDESKPMCKSTTQSNSIIMM